MPLPQLRPGLRRAFRLAIRRRDLTARDLSDELALYVDLRAAQLERRGYTPAEARREALRRLHAESVDEASRHLMTTRSRVERAMHLRERYEILRQDLGYTLRQLVRKPAFTAAVIGTIGLALAATATMFGVTDRLLLHPPAHIADAERVGVVEFLVPAPPGYFPAGTPDTTRMRDRTTSYPFFERVRADTAAPFRLAVTTFGRLVFGDGTMTELVRVEFASAGYFPLLGARPALGRWIADGEAQRGGGARVAVVSHAFWRSRLGGDERAVGSTVLLRGEPFTVVGVAPPGFAGANTGAVDLWLPITALDDGTEDSADLLTGPNHHIFRLLVRIQPDMPRQQAEAAILPYYREELATVPFKPDVRRASVEITPLTGLARSGARRAPEVTASLWLLGTAIVLLLVACANVASMLILRAEWRRREIAVRLALGMGRRRLVGQLLLEGLVLATLGAATALVITTWAGAAIQSLVAPDLPPDSWRVDARMVAVVAVATLGTALVTGLLPALHARRSDLRSALAAGGAGATGGASRRPRLQRPLLVAQASLSMVMLIGAGLFLRSLQNVQRVDLGLEPERVVAVTSELREAGWKRHERAEFYERAAAHVRGLPGVESTALAFMVPLETAAGIGVRQPAADSVLAAARGKPGGTMYNAVTPEFFRTLGMRLVQGRLLSDGDRRGTERVAVVTESMVTRRWPDGRPLGRCLYLDDMEECTTVVGVVRDPRLFRIREEPRPQLFVPLAQADSVTPGVLLVRTREDAAGYVGSVRQAVVGLAPTAPYIESRTLQSRIDPQMRTWQVGATLFSLFAGVAIVLAGVGLYSAMAYGVTLRLRELGIRMAVGATAIDVARIVVREAVWVAGVGAACGLVLALPASRRLESLLYGISSHDAATYLAAGSLLVTAALLASVVPSWRATRVDPMSVLRTD